MADYFDKIRPVLEALPIGEAVIYPIHRMKVCMHKPPNWVPFTTVGLHNQNGREAQSHYSEANQVVISRMKI